MKRIVPPPKPVFRRDTRGSDEFIVSRSAICAKMAG